VAQEYRDRLKQSSDTELDALAKKSKAMKRSEKELKKAAKVALGGRDEIAAATKALAAEEEAGPAAHTSKGGRSKQPGKT
jgi:undecaprenyl pyrophosphate synthase